MYIAVEETNNEINFYEVNGSTFSINKLIEMFKKANREIKQVFSYKSKSENDFIGAKLLYDKEKDEDMKRLNLNPQYEEILKTYGVDINTITLNKNGSINCGEHGDWSFGNHYDGFGVADYIIAYQTKDNFKSSWVFKDNKLEFFQRINLEK